MTSNGHIIFSLASSIFIKKLNFLKFLDKISWNYLIILSSFSCLLPDIDHPKSFLGKRFRFISEFIFNKFGHRGFTHSLTFTLLIYITLTSKFFQNTFISINFSNAIIIGYINHIIADILTPYGVPIFWPCKWRFKLPILNINKFPKLEKIFCILLLIISFLFCFKQYYNIHILNKNLINFFIKFFKKNFIFNNKLLNF